MTAPVAFTNNCAVCHGATAQSGVGPTLKGRKNIAGVTRSGKGVVPGFGTAQMSDADIVAIEGWLATFCVTSTSTALPPRTTTTTRPAGSTTSTTRPTSGSTSTSLPGSTTTSTTLPGGHHGDDGDDDDDDDHGDGDHRDEGQGYEDRGDKDHGSGGPGVGSGPGSTGGGPSASKPQCKRACRRAMKRCAGGRSRRRACKRQLLGRCQLEGVQGGSVAREGGGQKRNHQ